MSPAWRWIPRGILLGLLVFVIFGPLLNLALWAFAERWYFPHKLPAEFGLTFWGRVFAPRSNAMASLGTSVLIACLTVALSTALALPADVLLRRWRALPRVDVGRLRADLDEVLDPSL